MHTIRTTLKLDAFYNHEKKRELHTYCDYFIAVRNRDSQLIIAPAALMIAKTRHKNKGIDIVQ